MCAATASGERVVTAGDIAWPSEVEIVNPDQVIATLTGADAVLDMDLWVTRDRGYRPAEAPGGLLDRRDPDRRHLHADPEGQLRRRAHPRRPGDGLRPADPRDPDRRHDRAGGGALARLPAY